jgi:ferredoxin
LRHRIDTRNYSGMGVALVNSSAEIVSALDLTRKPIMPYVVCEPCHDCKYTDCVVVCPCDCFYQDESMLYIDPDHCIDCDACRGECPVSAIYPDEEVPQPWVGYVELNLRKTRELIAAKMGHITEKQEPKIGEGCRKV